MPFGNKGQGFFEHIVFWDKKQSFRLIKKQDGSFCLPVGGTHGFCDGDRFVLFLQYLRRLIKAPEMGYVEPDS
jgi:hypothetical protein